MAQIGDVLAANRYGALASGPFFQYTFETQEGLPVDGSNAHLRNLSPFTLRILPPSILLNAAASDDGEGTDDFSTTLLEAAAQQADGTMLTSEVQAALGNTFIGNLSDATLTGSLETFVSNGALNMGQNTNAIPTLADAYVAADIALQLRNILNVPPLTLLINPNSFSISYNKLQNFSSRTRFGYVFEAWGEEQPRLTISGSTGAFIAGAVDTGNPFGGQAEGQTSTPSGVQFAAKRNSAAWQNLMGLFQFYKNNGYIYDTLGQSEAHLMIGALAIDWDQWTYVGHMDSFKYQYDENIPHRVTFDIEFIVSRIYDWGQTPSAVSPQSSPTASPSSHTQASSATSLRAAGRSVLTVTGQDIGQVPLQILGGFE